MAMAMDWRGEVDALVAEALGARPDLVVELAADGVWRADAQSLGTARDRTTIAARARSVALSLGDGACASVVLSLLGHAPAASDRQALLGELARAMPPGARLVVVDHNRPRRLIAALGAVIATPRVRGRSPTARWRRLAYPVAREVQAWGFEVRWLRFAAGERIQVILARRSGAADDA